MKAKLKSGALMGVSCTLAALVGCSDPSSNVSQSPSPVTRIESSSSHEVPLSKLMFGISIVRDEASENDKIHCVGDVVKMNGPDFSMSLGLKNGDQMTCNGVVMTEKRSTVLGLNIATGIEAEIEPSPDGRYTVAFTRDGVTYSGEASMPTSPIVGYEFSPRQMHKADSLKIRWDSMVSETDQKQSAVKEIDVKALKDLKEINTSTESIMAERTTTLINAETPLSISPADLGIKNRDNKWPGDSLQVTLRMRSSGSGFKNAPFKGTIVARRERRMTIRIAP